MELRSRNVEVADQPGQSVRNQPRLRVLIVHGDAVVRSRLRRALQMDGRVELVGQCASGRSAMALIRERTPDLVFLAIELPDVDGFAVIGELAEPRPEVALMAESEEYATRAFAVDAVDYLLKPYERTRVRGVIERACSRRRDSEATVAIERRLRDLLHTLRADGSRGAGAPSARYRERIAVRIDGATRVMPIADVDWFETDGNYVRAQVGQASFLIRHTASRLQHELDPRRFVRIHRRYLVNLDRIVGLEPWFGSDAVVVLRSGKKLRLSRNYRAELDARMLGDHSVGSGEAAIE